MNMKPNHASTFRPTIATVAISIFILASIINAAVSVFGNFWNRGDNMFFWIPEYATLTSYENEDACNHPMTDVTVTDRLVVLRIDDPQAYIWTDVVKLMIADARSYGYKPVLGIIPNKLEDDRLFSLYLSEHACEFEIAQHGFYHHKNGDYDIPEFGSISEKEAEWRLNEGRRILEALASEPITTFIPPQNMIDPDVLHLFDDAGFTVISRYDDALYDADISTYEYKGGYLEDVDEVLSACDERFAAEDACILTLHPQDYATDGEVDSKKYRSYTELLDGLRARDVNVVTFKELRKILR